MAATYKPLAQYIAINAFFATHSLFYYTNLLTNETDSKKREEYEMLSTKAQAELDFVRRLTSPYLEEHIKRYRNETVQTVFNENDWSPGSAASVFFRR